MLSEALHTIESDMKYIPTVVGKMSNADVSILLDNIQKHLADVTSESKAAAKAVYRIACGTDSAQQGTLLAVIAVVRDSCISGDAADAKVLKSAISLLSFMLSNFSLSSASRGQLGRLIHTVWSTFLVLYRYDKSKEVQSECLWVLCVLLQAEDTRTVLYATDFQCAEVIDKCIEICGKAFSSGQRLKSTALQLMGALAKTYPADVVPQESRMFRCFMTVAKKLTAEGQAAQSVGEGFFIGLKDFLISFPRNFDDVSQQENVILVHQMVKNALLLAESSSNYRFCKAALLFLRVHADSTLAECVLEDADSYFSILKMLWVHKNTDVHRECYPAAASFFRSLSRQLAVEAPSTSAHQARVHPKELLSRLLEDLRATLQSKESGHGQIMFALVAFGYMARPIHVCFGIAAIHAYFTEISGRSDTILSAAVAREQGGEDFARVIPQLLTAFACFLLEIGSIDQVGVEAVRALLEAMLVLYPHEFYFERLRVVTVPSLLKLFVALSHHQCRTELIMYFCRRTLQLLAPMRATAGAANADEEGEAQAEERKESEGEKVALYAQLWNRLLQSDSFLSPDERWGYPWDTVDCGAALQLLQAGMQSVSIEVVAHADLAVVSKAKGPRVSLQEITNRSVDVEPRAPEEYSYFLSFVSFQAAILPALWHVRTAAFDHNEEEEEEGNTGDNVNDTTQLTLWTVGLVEASERYPHVSGLFQLLSATLWETPSVQLLSAAQRDGCQVYAASCLYRSHIYTEELLYRCAVLVIVLSDKLVLQDVPCAQLGGLFHTVVAADGGTAVSRLEEVEGNIRIALDVLRRWIKTRPALAAQIILQLLSGKLVMRAGAQAQLCAMAAECGMLIARHMENRGDGGDEGFGSSSHTSHSFQLQAGGEQPQWKVQSSVLPLFLPPMKVEFPVYGLLSRIVELCFHGDQTTATTAAELFHFIVVWTIGNDKDKETEWYSDMFPAVIRLAANTEKSVTQELFHDLLFMCARWFSAKPNADGFTRSLLHLLESEDASLRLTATVGLLEYIRGAEKSQNKEQSSVAIAQVMSVLNAKLLADAPWPRLGAAGVLQQLLKAVLGEHIWHHVSYVPHCLRSVMASLQKTALEMMHDELGIIAELTACVHVMESVVNSKESTGTRRIQALLCDASEQGNTHQLLTEAARAAVAVAPHHPQTTATLIRFVTSVNSLRCSNAVEAEQVRQEWVKILHGILCETPPSGAAHTDQVHIAIASMVLYTTLRQDAEARQPAGVKRSRDEADGGDHLALLLQDTLSNVSTVMNSMGKDSETSPLSATQHHFCEVLSTFLSTYATFSNVRAFSLDMTQLSVLARRFLASPVPCRADNEDGKEALARCVCVLLVQPPLSKEHVASLINSMKLLVPSYLLQPSSTAADVLHAYRSNPHDVCHELGILCRLTRFAVNPSGPSVWSDVVRASGAAGHIISILCQVVGILLQQRDLGRQSSDRMLLLSLLHLLFALDFSPALLLDAAFKPFAKQTEKTTHVELAVNVGFFVEQFQAALPAASLSSLYVLLDALVTATVERMEEHIAAHRRSNEEEEEEGEQNQKEEGAITAVVWVAAHDIAAQALCALLEELKGRPITAAAVAEMGGHLSKCCDALLFRPAIEDDGSSRKLATVASFKLRVLKLVFEVDQSAAHISTAACARVIDFMRQAASSEHWSGAKYKLLAERSITDMFLRVSEVVCAALGRVERRTLSENATAMLKASEELVKYTLDNEMPLDWRELTPETSTSDNYHRVVHAVVAMMRVIIPCDVSSTLLLLPLISMTDFPESDLLSLTVSAALREVDTTSLVRLCDEATALQRSQLPRPLWWAATYGILLPLLRSFPGEAQVSFFQRNVPLWVKQADASVHATCFQQCNALLLLEAAYKLLDQKVLKGPINDAFLGGAQSGTGKELTVKMIKVCGSARQYNLEDKGEEATEFRQVAYRCLTAVLMATQDNEAVFVKLLLDSKNTEHWNGIVSAAGLSALTVEVSFPRISEADAKKYSEWELARRPKVSKVKRNKLLEKTLRSGPSMRMTGPSSGAALAFGFEDSVREPAQGPVSEGQASSVVVGTAPPPSGRPVDIDSIWRSTCSGALFSLLDFLIGKSCKDGQQQGGSSSTSKGTPTWVQEVVSLLNSDGLLLEAKLVWLKLILLRPSFFRAFAGLLAAPLLSVACDGSLGPHLHYIARELLHTLLGWFADGSLVADSQVANLLIPFLLQTVPNTDSAYVLRYNVELFKKLFAHIKSKKCLSATHLLSLVETRKDNDSQIQATCQMCAAVVDEGTALASLGAKSDVLKLYGALTRLISHAVPSCVLAVSETLAMELRALKTEDKEGLQKELRDKVQLAVESLRKERFSLLLKVVKTVQMWDTAAAAPFLSNGLFANFTGLSPGDQMMVLEILGGSPAEAAAMYDTILVQFAGALNRYDDAVKVHFLELLAALVPRAHSAMVEKVTLAFLTADTLEALRNNTDCRVAFFQCCVSALKAYGKQEQLVRLVVEKGLQDPFPFIQNIVLEYMDTGYLSADPSQRLRELLQLSPAERSWPRHCAVMLLSLCHRAPDFANNKYFFPNPLTDCEFEEKTLRPSRTLSADPMTPLFSQTDDKALSATPSAFVFPTASQCYTAEQQQAGGRSARVAMAPPPRFAAPRGRALPHSLAPPTQVAQFTSYSMATPPVELHSSLLFSRSDDEHAAAGQPLLSLARQLREMPTEVRNLRYMSASAKQKQQRIRREKANELLRAKEEIIFRRYRAGEVPDIQVSLQALVTPLQALCLHDTQLASAVCAPLMMELFRSGSGDGGGGRAGWNEEEQSTQPPGVDGAVESYPLYAPLQTFIAAITSSVDQAGKSAFRFNMEVLLRFTEVVGGRLAQRQVEALLHPCRQGLLSADDMHEAANAVIHVLDLLHLEKPAAAAMPQPEPFVWSPLSDAFALTHDAERAGEATKHFLGKPEVQLLAEVRWRAKTGGLSEGIKRLEQWLQQHAAAAVDEEGKHVYATLNRQRGRACAALLQWSDVWDAFKATEAHQLQDMSLLLPAALRCAPDSVARVLDNRAITRAAVGAQYPFEWSVFLLDERHFIECEAFITESVSHLLLRHQNNAGGRNASSFVSAYKLYTVLQCAKVLSLVSEEREGAVEKARRLVSTFAVDTPLTNARLVDDMALAQQSFERLLFGPDLQQKLPPEYAHDLRAQCQTAQMQFLTEHCNYLLDDGAQNGAVKQLLSTVLSLSAHCGDGGPGVEDLKVKIRSAALRANLYRVAVGARWLRARPREALETVMEKAELLPVRVQSQVRLDHAVCRLQLDLQQPAVPSRTMDGVLGDLRYLATNGKSEESALRLLDVVDRILSLYPDVDYCTAEVEGCWRLLAETFVRCIAQYGLTQPQSKKGQMAPLFCVPHLLQLLDLRVAHAFTLPENVWDDLFAQMATLPSSVWLPWTSQLISALLRTEHVFAAQLLYQLAQDYPQSVYYPFRCVKEEMDAIHARAKRDPAKALACACFEGIREALEHNQRLARLHVFAQCLPKLHDPVLRFKEMIQSVLKEMYLYKPEEPQTRVHYDKAQSLFAQFHATCLDVTKLDRREVVSLDFAHTASPYIARLCPSGRLLASYKELSGMAGSVLKELEVRFPSKSSLTLENYSVRLAALLDGNAGTGTGRGTGMATTITGTDRLLPLEPPVQPIMWLHPRPAAAEHIIGVAPTVQTLSSLQRPKRLVLHTTQRSLVVLVKGGDDLRMDQRVQEFFMLLSRFLVQDGNGHLYLRTYSVVPVSKQMGLVEWVPRTRTINEVINAGMGRRGLGKDTAKDPRTAEYRQRYGSNVKAYTNSYVETGSHDVARWYRSLVARIDPLCLTSALHDIAADRCGAYEVRRRFQRTHATLSIASYLFGIGDRHLSNFLVDTRTGDLISIDFGHAFGSATYTLPVPELVPFRLTPQIQGALGALGCAVTAAPMGSVLRVLRERRTVVESIASAFAQEPLEQWKSKVVPSQLAEMAKMRVNSVRQKLELEHPYHILRKDLRQNQHLAPNVREAIEKVIVKATEDEEDEGENSPESVFIQRLIHLATSDDVLGRCYAGWQPLF